MLLLNFCTVLVNNSRWRHLISGSLFFMNGFQYSSIAASQCKCYGMQCRLGYTVYLQINVDQCYDGIWLNTWMTLIVQQGSSNCLVNCAFYGKSITFCTMIMLTKTIILRSGPILKVTCGELGGYFEGCPLWNVFLSIVVTALPSITWISLVYVCQTISV